MQVQDFPTISLLGAGSSSSVTMGIDFADTTQPAVFDIHVGDKKFKVTIKAPVGELLQPVTYSENDFISLQSKFAKMQQSVRNFC